jgi:hypothetical protein
VDAQLVCLNKGSAGSGERVQYYFALAEIDLTLEVSCVAVKKVLYKLRDELAFVGMEPVHMLGGLSLFDPRKRQVPVDVLTKSLFEFVAYPTCVMFKIFLKVFQDDRGLTVKLVLLNFAVLD